MPDKVRLIGEGSGNMVLYVIAVTENGNERYLKNFKRKGTFLEGFDLRLTDYRACACKGDKQTMSQLKKLLGL